MADQEKRALNIEDLEVTELEDSALEDAAGGTNTCPINMAAGCGVPLPASGTGTVEK